jgi:hypothetical protein
MQATRIPDDKEQETDNKLIAEMNKLNSENEAKAAQRYNNAMIRADRMYPMVDGVRTDNSAYNAYLSDAESNIATSLKSDFLKISEVELTEDEKAALEAGTLPRYAIVDGIKVPDANGEYIWVSSEYNTILTDIALQYTTQKGTVVRVVYEEGIEFILNYNSFAVGINYDGDAKNTYEYEIEPMGFVKIEK